MFLVGACGGIVTAGEAPGFLFSPGWPGSYPPNLDCSWLIRSDSTVELNLLSVDIEDFPMCYLDSLVIRDGELWRKSDTHTHTCTHTYTSRCGCKTKALWIHCFSSALLVSCFGGNVCPGLSSGPSSLSPLLATVCGRDPPGNIHSTGDSMFLLFSSDSIISGQGFNASYSKGVSTGATSHPTPPHPDWTDHHLICLGCGGLLHVDRGTVSTPNYPQNYRRHLNCSWHVMVTPGFRVSASFQSPFQVQGYGTECSSGDYLEVTLSV